MKRIRSMRYRVGARGVLLAGAGLVLAVAPCAGRLAAAPQATAPQSVTVPFVLDHNRMLVDVEMQRADGTWRTARMWIDTGEPRFPMTEALARDLGADLSALATNAEVRLPGGVRIGGKPLDLTGVVCLVGGPQWQYNSMHNDGHFPSTVLQRYQVVFDYPARTLTIADPGAFEHRGERAPASINRETGIVQIDARIDGDSLSLALDMGAAYSFMDVDVLEKIVERHPDAPHITGTAGCADMWGWWPPDAQEAPVLRIVEGTWGPVPLAGVGVVGVWAVAPNGPALGAWYSQKSARPVKGFLGPNAFKAYRVEIDYVNGAVYFEKGSGPDDSHDMDVVGLTLRPENDGSYTVIGTVKKGKKLTVEGVVPGDKLLRVGSLEVTGATMGTVVDALRGKPGDVRTLILERGGAKIRIDATVKRLL